MKMEEDPNLVIVDVREPSEYVEGHVPGAVNVPLSTLSDAAKQGRFDGYEDRTVHIICQLGGRSKKACLALSEQYQTLDLINVMGGTAEWIQSGYDVQK